MQSSQKISRTTFNTLCATGKTISSHSSYGPKVVLLPNGDYLKVFNPKPGLTKRRFFPKYKAFIRNTESLNKLGVPSVQVTKIYHLEGTGAYAVQYTSLMGTDVRTLASSQTQPTLEKFIPFLVELHEKGIYFRGIHLGNVLRLDNGRYGLIDVADLYCKRAPLSMLDRVRNLAHMLNNRDDALLYERVGRDNFINSYVKEAKLFDLRNILFKFWLKCYLGR